MNLDWLDQKEKVAQRERVVCKDQEVFQVLLEILVKEVQEVLLGLLDLLDQLENLAQLEEEVCLDLMDQEVKKENQEIEE